MPPTTSPSPFSSAMPRRSSGTSSTRATSREQHRRAALGLDDDLLEIGEALDVAAAADHELGLGHLDRAAADIHVAVADRLADARERDVERLQPARIDDDAVLLDEAADARDLGHALGALARPKRTYQSCSVRSSARLFCAPRTTYW